MRNILALTALLGVVSCTAPTQKKTYPPADLSLPALDSDFVWEVDIDKSQIKFKATEKQKSFTGHFKAFNILVAMNPNDTETAHIEAIIDLSSVSAGNADRDDVLKTAEWFYLEKYPVARFRSSSVSKTGPKTFEARGNLTVKDVTKEIVLPFTLEQNGSEAVAKARFGFNRLDYKLGVGSFGDEKYVGYPVMVMITVKAKR